VLTEIRKFVLTSVGSLAGRQCPPDPRIPSVPLMWPMVTAGTGAGVFPRSLGIVQENTPTGTIISNFPARSFFDVFVNVNLPPVPGTVSVSAFPTNGALLYNDSPLIVSNTSLNNLPPSVIYIHGETAAVPVKFLSNNPPYWAAGEIFGYLVLAGHGTISSDCTETTAVNALLNATLGPVGQPVSGLPVEWLRPTNLSPSPGSSYDSAMGTNSGGQTIDYISFTFPSGGTMYGRNFSEGSLTVPIPPPPYFGTNYYDPSNTLATMELSSDASNWIPAQASGPILVTISNTTATGSTTSTFATQLRTLDLAGDSQFGPFMLRASPTKPSLGQHTIRSDPRGYRVSSFFDVFVELSIDGGNTWIPANRSIRVQASAPPAAPNSIFVTVTNGSVGLNWLGAFTLQSATNLIGPFTDITGPATNYSTKIGAGQMYFRLRN